MKYLNSQEYNTIVLAITESSDYVARGRQGKSKEQFYKTLFDKLFTITEDDLLKSEEVNHPIKKTNEEISNDYWEGTR
jgi:CRISPR/Cas system CSM-associated protein Csm2 small subunit